MFIVGQDLSNKAHQANDASLSKLDCPHDFLKENRPFLALKNRLPTDHPTDEHTLI